MTTTDGETRSAIWAVVSGTCPNAVNGSTSKKQSTFFMATSACFSLAFNKRAFGLGSPKLIVAPIHNEKWAMKRPAVAEGPKVKRTVFEVGLLKAYGS